VPLVQAVQVVQVQALLGLMVQVGEQGRVARGQEQEQGLLHSGLGR